MKVKSKKLKVSMPKKSKNKKKPGPKVKTTSSNKTKTKMKTKKVKSSIKKKSLKKARKQLSIIKTKVKDTEHEYNRPNYEILIKSKSEFSYKSTSDDNEQIQQKCTMHQNFIGTKSNVNENILAVDDNQDLLNSIIASTIQEDKKNQNCYNENILARNDKQTEANNTLTNAVQDYGNTNNNNNMPIDCHEKYKFGNMVQVNDETTVIENIPVDDQRNNKIKSICYPNNIFVDDQKNNILKSPCYPNNTLVDEQKNNILKSTFNLNNITDESNNRENNCNISLNSIRTSTCESKTTTNDTQKIKNKQLENKCIVKYKCSKSFNKLCTNQETQTENVISSNCNRTSKNYTNNNINIDERNTEAQQFKRNIPTYFKYYIQLKTPLKII